MMDSTKMSGVQNDEWSQAAGKARDAAGCVGEMANHAAAAVGAMAGQTVGNAGRQMDDLTASAGVAMEGLGARISQNAPRSGVLGGVSQAAAKAVQDGGEYLERAKLSGMTGDLANLIRQNPLPAVAIALGLGWFLASKLKG